LPSQSARLRAAKMDDAFFAVIKTGVVSAANHKGPTGMYRLYDHLEKYGLVSGLDLRKIHDLPAKQFEDLYDKVYETLYEAQCSPRKDSLSASGDAFSFQASASIRGASGCGELVCQLSKIDFLARYSALYANELIFPLTLPHPSKAQGIWEMRACFSRDALALLYLRPLVTAGIVVPVVMRSFHCIHETAWVDKMMKLVHEFSDMGAKYWRAEFRLIYQRLDKSPTGRPTFYLDGPKDYIEHGSLVQLASRAPGWIPKSARFDQDGRTEIRGRHKEHFVRAIFHQFAENITFYLAYGQRRNARLLSDMPGETEFLEWMTTDDTLSAKSEALRELHHSVPILADLPIATILRVRKNEREAFQTYRETVTEISASILSAKRRTTKAEAREMFRDAIEPALNVMRREARAYRKVHNRRVLSGVASLAAGVAIGAYAGLPPLVAVPIAAAATLVGGRLLTKAAEAACEHGPEFEQKNNMYFLLRLADEANMQKSRW
jgi:hypothetical protein